MEEEPSLPKGLGEQKSRQNLTNRAKTLDDTHGGDSTKVGSPAKFIRGTDLNTTGYTSQGGTTPAVQSYKNFMMTTGAFSISPEHCPYNTSTAKQKYSFSKTQRFPNYQRYIIPSPL